MDMLANPCAAHRAHSTSWWGALLLACCWLSASVAAGGNETQADRAASQTVAVSEVSTPAHRPRVVLVKPVILCDDDGSHPAGHVLPKTLVDRVYAKAGLEFVYLEPVLWHHGRARRGEFNLDQIVHEGLESRTICRDRRVVTLLFVSAVDGQPGPLGRGRQNGNICFVALGPERRETEPAMQAFVVAHEIGHCLNLKHVVDDPAVPDDVPNLQGEGAWEDRLAVAGLHDTQRDTVLQSPLVLDRIRFHNLQQGRQLIADESWEPYIAEATDDMLRFSMGLNAEAPIPQVPETRKQFAQANYAEKVLEFSDQEQKRLSHLVTQLTNLTGKQWPLVGRLPWHFIKVDSSFCKGMAHTRGLAIVLSDQFLRRIAENERFGMKLLLHEKLHVIQRLNRPRFESLYEAYGFQKVELADGELQRVHLAQNPDGFPHNWGIDLGNTPTMLLTVLASGDDGGFKFQTEYRTLSQLADGSFAIGEKHQQDTAFHEWQDSFPLTIGHDHPNEVSAYLSGLLLERDLLDIDKPTLTEAQAARIDETRHAFRQVLRMDGE